MEIEWIGTGSGLNPALGNTSFLVRNGTDRTLLVDCGSTVPLELIRSGKLKDVTDVLVTHAHTDHMGGLEGMGFMNYFAYKRRGDARPNLYVGTDLFAYKLWENSLRNGMENAQGDDNTPMKASLDTYFNVKAGRQITVPGFPLVELFPTLHVQGLENYGVAIGNDVWYSGDSVEVPKTDARLVFQDCQFYETKSDVHISYGSVEKVP
jgi:ribonuclease BN (tRNA processing enzyme)